MRARPIAFLLVVLALFVCGPLALVQASCSGQQLGAISPAQGAKVQISYGQCAGVITIAYDNIHVAFEQGSEIDSTANIQFSSAVTLTNITVAIQGVTWKLRTGSLFSSSVTTELVGSSLTLKNSTVQSSGDDPIGLLTGPSLTSSNFTVDNCSLTGTSKYGIAFGGTLTNTTVSVINGTHLTTSGSFHVYGLYFLEALTASTVTMSELTVMTTAGGTYNAYGTSFVKTLTDSTVTIRHCNLMTTATGNKWAYNLLFSSTLTASTVTMSESILTTTGSHAHAVEFNNNNGALTATTVTMSGLTMTTSGNYYAYGLFVNALTDSNVTMRECTLATTSDNYNAYGIYFPVTLTDSAVMMSDCTSTATTSSSSSANEGMAMYIHADLTSTTNITVVNSVLVGRSTAGMAKGYSMVKRIKTASNYHVGTMTLQSSNFTGKDDRAGPFYSALLETNAIGRLLVPCTHWNDPLTTMNPTAMRLSGVNSTQLTISEDGCTPVAPTPAPSNDFSGSSSSGEQFQSSASSAQPTPAPATPDPTPAPATPDPTPAPPTPAPPAQIRVGDGYSNSVQTYSEVNLPLLDQGYGYTTQGVDGWTEAGFALKGSTYFYGGLAVDGNLWMIPLSTNPGGDPSHSGLAKVNMTTGSITKYSNWPSGHSPGDSYGGCVYDGKWLWVLPLSSPLLLKVDPMTGNMTGYTFPQSYSSAKFSGASVVSNGTYLWLTPSAATDVIRVETNAQANMTTFRNWPSGFTWKSKGLAGATFDGTYHWMFPGLSNRWVLGMNTQNGTMIGFNGQLWPSSIVMSQETYNPSFLSGISTNGTNLYLIPCHANSVVHLDTATGVAVGYKDWPSTFSLPAFFQNCLFQGAAFDGKYIWMPPRSTYSNTMLMRFDPVSGSFMGYNSWPSGFDEGSTSPFVGIAIQPSTNGSALWLIPYHADMIVKVSVAITAPTPAPTPTLPPTSGCPFNLHPVTLDFPQTYTVRRDECPGSITVSSDDVTIVFEEGAGYFQDNKMIILPGGNLHRFNLTIWSVVWDINTADKKVPLFSSSGSSNTLHHSHLHIFNSTIKSDQADPLGFAGTLAFLYNSSTYLVERSSITVTGPYGTSTIVGFLLDRLYFGSSLTISGSNISTSSIWKYTVQSVKVPALYSGSSVNVIKGSRITSGTTSGSTTGAQSTALSASSSDGTGVALISDSLVEATTSSTRPPTAMEIYAVNVIVTKGARVMALSTKQSTQTNIPVAYGIYLRSIRNAQQFDVTVDQGSLISAKSDGYAPAVGIEFNSAVVPDLAPVIVTITDAKVESVTTATSDFHRADYAVAIQISTPIVAGSKFEITNSELTTVASYHSTNTWSLRFVHAENLDLKVNASSFSTTGGRTNGAGSVGLFSSSAVASQATGSAEFLCSHWNSNPASASLLGLTGTSGANFVSTINANCGLTPAPLTPVPTPAPTPAPATPAPTPLPPGQTAVPPTPLPPSPAPATPTPAPTPIPATPAPPTPAPTPLPPGQTAVPPTPLPPSPAPATPTPATPAPATPAPTPLPPGQTAVPPTPQPPTGCAAYPSQSSCNNDASCMWVGDAQTGSCSDTCSQLASTQQPCDAIRFDSVSTCVWNYQGNGPCLVRCSTRYGSNQSACEGDTNCAWRDGATNCKMGCALMKTQTACTTLKSQSQANCIWTGTGSVSEFYKCEVNSSSTPAPPTPVGQTPIPATPAPPANTPAPNTTAAPPTPAPAAPTTTAQPPTSTPTAGQITGSPSTTAATVTSFDATFDAGDPNSPKTSTEFADNLAKELSKQFGQSVDPNEIDVTSFNPTTGDVQFKFVGSSSASLSSKTKATPAQDIGLTGLAANDSPAAAPPSSGGLAAGAIAGIIIAVVIVVVIVGAVVGFLVKGGKSAANEFEGGSNLNLLTNDLAFSDGGQGGGAERSGGVELNEL